MRVSGSFLSLIKFLSSLNLWQYSQNVLKPKIWSEIKKFCFNSEIILLSELDGIHKEVGTKYIPTFLSKLRLLSCLQQIPSKKGFYVKRELTSTLSAQRDFLSMTSDYYWVVVLSWRLFGLVLSTAKCFKCDIVMTMMTNNWLVVVGKKTLLWLSGLLVCS